MFNPFPGTVDATLTIHTRPDPLGRVIQAHSGKAVLRRCMIDHLSWSVARGLFDQSEEDKIALNFPCCYHESIMLEDGSRQLTHDDFVIESEVEIPAGSAMAGVWLVDSLPACSNDPDLGDTIRLKRK